MTSLVSILLLSNLLFEIPATVRRSVSRYEKDSTMLKSAQDVSNDEGFDAMSNLADISSANLSISQSGVPFDVKNFEAGTEFLSEGIAGYTLKVRERLGPIPAGVVVKAFFEKNDWRNTFQRLRKIPHALDPLVAGLWGKNQLDDHQFEAPCVHADESRKHKDHTGTCYWIVMQWGGDQTLTQCLKKAPDEATASTLLIQGIHILQQVHHEFWYHWDPHSDNVLVNADCDPRSLKLVDLDAFAHYAGPNSPEASPRARDHSWDFHKLRDYLLLLTMHVSGPDRLQVTNKRLSKLRQLERADLPGTPAVKEQQVSPNAKHCKGSFCKQRFCMCKVMANLVETAKGGGKASGGGNASEGGAKHVEGDAEDSEEAIKGSEGDAKDAEGGSQASAGKGDVSEEQDEEKGDAPEGNGK